jgi:hypothetical protein
MVYEATTIAHRTPPALAVTTVGGTCGVFKTSFWPNIASAPRVCVHTQHEIYFPAASVYSSNQVRGALLPYCHVIYCPYTQGRSR